MKPSSVRVACAQLDISIDRPQDNLAASLRAIADAADQGAQVIVLPELACSGYVFADAAELARSAEPQDGPTVTAWAAAAQQHQVVLVGGFPEHGAGGSIFNTAVLITPEGGRSFYRKAHLWDQERAIFTPGDGPPPVLDTAYGRIAVMVCYDLEFPEWVRKVALDGAELICAPVNWPWSPRPEAERPVEIVKTQAGAAVNRVAIAVCDRAGTERGVRWVGGSVIVDAEGYPVTPLSLESPALLVADVDLVATRTKTLGPSNDVFADRRVELYGLASAPAPASGATVQHDTERVRVTRWTLPTGASTGQHVHEHDYVVIPLTAGRMTVTDSSGTTTHNPLTPGQTYVRRAGVHHEVGNADPTLVDFVEVELLEDPPAR